jgi:protein transport protein SEC61 subunit gamma and related proteins
MVNVKGFITNAIRVLQLTTKPKKEEFWTVTKITGLGIIILGAIGYITKSFKFLFG